MRICHNPSILHGIEHFHTKVLEISSSDLVTCATLHGPSKRWQDEVSVPITTYPYSRSVHVHHLLIPRKEALAAVPKCWNGLPNTQSLLLSKILYLDVYPNNMQKQQMDKWMSKPLLNTYVWIIQFWCGTAGRFLGNWYGFYMFLLGYGSCPMLDLSGKKYRGSEIGSRHLETP